MQIRKRIEKAYSEKSKFRVYIFLPLVVAFSGDISKTQSIKTIFKYTFRTINRHKGYSLVEKLIEIMGDKFLNYISFYSLRNHTELHNTPKTELIYIHAKVMIVDDEKVIIGSANINDRSMLGERDSEVAVLIQKGEKIPSIMNSVNVEVSKFAFDFRTNLFKLYLDLKDDSNLIEILRDPVSDEFYSLLSNTSRKNTMIYREIFKPIPDDVFTTCDDFKYSHIDSCSHCLKMIREKYYKNKDSIKGFIVDYPLSFLKDENLDRGFTMEKAVPVNMFL